MAVSVPPATFVRLKLRLTVNGLRGQTWRVALFVLGILLAIGFAAGGYAIFAVPGLLDDNRVAATLLTLGGAAILLGWLFLPLVFFGVDESLDPARFALLPLRRHTLIGERILGETPALGAAGKLVRSCSTCWRPGVKEGATRAVSSSDSSRSRTRISGEEPARWKSPKSRKNRNGDGLSRRSAR